MITEAIKDRVEAMPKGTSIVIGNSVACHSARFPYVFIRSEQPIDAHGRFKFAELGSLTDAGEPEGCHEDRQDGCWYKRWPLKKLSKGIHVARTMRDDGHRVEVKLNVDGINVTVVK